MDLGEELSSFLVLFKIAFYKGIEAREDIILWVKIQ